MDVIDLFKITSNRLIWIPAVLILMTSILNPLNAQELPVLEKKISISTNGERLDQFLKRISKEIGCVFSYSPSAIDVSKTIFGNFQNQSLREILENVFENQVEIKQKGNYVILSPKSSSDKGVVVSGYVVDETTKIGIRDVTIYDPITLKSTNTDEFGFFELTVKNPSLENIELVINKKDYTDTLVVKNSKNPFQKILLKTNEMDMEEVGRTITKPLKDFWLWTKNSVGFTNLENVSDTIHRGFQMSLIPFVGTNRKLSGNVVNDYSLNILGGFSGGTNKLEFGGLFNLNKGNVKSVQVAGLLNQVSGTVKGFQLAGLSNTVLDSVNAAQVAGLINFSTGNVKGFQLAGLINLGTSDFRGFQLAGLANYTNRDVDGLQMAGLLNVGRNVKGTQIGLFNYADSLKGAQIGLISFVRKGYHQVEIGADEMLPLNVSLRSGTRSFYNMLFAGLRTDSSDSTTWAFGYGIGTSPTFGKKTALNIELSAQQVNKGNVSALNLVNRLYIGMEFRLANKFHFYAGPSLNLRVYDSSYADHPTLFTYTNPTIRSENSILSENLATQLWIGGRAGFRFF